MNTIIIALHPATEAPKEPKYYPVITDNRKEGGSVIQWTMRFYDTRNECWTLHEWDGRVVFWTDLPEPRQFCDSAGVPSMEPAF